MPSRRCDVAVVGAGPAGAAAALTLTRAGFDVALLEASEFERPRLGETLPPSARPVLDRLGLGRDVAATASTPSFGNQSAWGSQELAASPFIVSPYGNGSHLDRQRFDSVLAGAAAGAGARLLKGVRVAACAPALEGGWCLTLGGGAPVGAMTAKAVVDATGRRAGLARSLGAGRRVRDRLVGAAVQYRGGSVHGGYTLVEAVRDGWWYSAPLPPDKLIVMLMTDADLCRSGRYADPAAWDKALAQARHTHRRVAGLQPRWRPRVASAASHRLHRTGSPGGWLAAGDAAMGVDPLSGTGLVQALATGELAGRAIGHWLLGRPGPARDYERWLDARFEDYWTTRSAYYALETRWPTAPFWRRRVAPQR
jgi:flavin-dependent dehydrogenase